MLFPVHLTLFFNFLFLWASKIEANVCQNIDAIYYFFDPYLDQDDLDLQDIKENCLCHFYPTKVLNCSWSLDHLPATQIVPHISICDSNALLQDQILSADERVGSASFDLQDVAFSYVALQFNLTVQDSRTVYTDIYDRHSLEVSPPPANISTSLMDQNLLVTWSLPKSDIFPTPSCFKYQLDIGDGEAVRDISEALSYTVENVDPSQAYRVRMRASFHSTCQQQPHWSEWSPVSTVVGASHSRPNVLVIVLIFLGIPMILLALLLLVRYQRVCKTIFPPIPRPPPKYLYFLEKNDGLSIYHPRTPVEEEAITAVLHD